MVAFIKHFYLKCFTMCLTITHSHTGGSKLLPVLTFRSDLRFSLLLKDTLTCGHERNCSVSTVAPILLLLGDSLYLFSHSQLICSMSHLRPWQADGSSQKPLKGTKYCDLNSGLRLLCFLRQTFTDSLGSGDPEDIGPQLKPDWQLKCPCRSNLIAWLISPTKSPSNTSSASKILHCTYTRHPGRDRNTFKNCNHKIFFY